MVNPHDHFQIRKIRRYRVHRSVGQREENNIPQRGKCGVQDGYTGFSNCRSAAPGRHATGLARDAMAQRGECMNSYDGAIREIARTETPLSWQSRL